MSAETFADAYRASRQREADSDLARCFAPPEPPAPVARHTDPETSHAAADDARRTCSTGRRLVLAHLAGGALTDFELADATGWQQTSIGKRRGECAQAGWVSVVMANGAKLTRPAPSGSAALVWQLTDAGRAKLREIEG